MKYGIFIASDLVFQDRLMIKAYIMCRVSTPVYLTLYIVYSVTVTLSNMYRVRYTGASLLKLVF